MTSSEERTRIAAELRAYAPESWRSDRDVLEAVLDMIGAPIWTSTRREWLDRLADLIDPTEAR